MIVYFRHSYEEDWTKIEYKGLTEKEKRAVCNFHFSKWLSGEYIAIKFE